MIATYNDFVTYRARAMARMGMDPAPENLGFPFLPPPPPTSKPAKCKRPRLVTRPAAKQDSGYGPLFKRLLYARASLPELRPAKLRPYSLFARRQLTPGERAFKAESDRVQRQFADLRPLDTDECRPGAGKHIRPCPWAACRFSLLVSVNDSGSIKADHGHLDPGMLEESCAIDVAQNNKEGVSQERAAELAGVTEDRIRQVERALMAGLRRKAKGLRADLRDRSDEWGAADRGGRQTCLTCDGSGEDGCGRDCANCAGEGYRWTEGATEESLDRQLIASCDRTPLSWRSPGVLEPVTTRRKERSNF